MELNYLKHVKKFIEDRAHQEKVKDYNGINIIFYWKDTNLDFFKEKVQPTKRKDTVLVNDEPYLLVKVSENTRGRNPAKVIVDTRMPYDIFHTIVMPCLIFTKTIDFI